jgi:hypothetical protein
MAGREELRNVNDRHDARFARWHWDDDGSLVLTARLSPEDGAVGSGMADVIKAS